jgi:hypothetical protein
MFDSCIGVKSAKSRRFLKRIYYIDVWQLNRGKKREVSAFFEAVMLVYLSAS